jgi:general secretion pathway protein B
MSSIIDALKKSDQSRHKDNTKQVSNINFSEQPAPKNRRGFWLLVALLLLIALAAFGWQQGWHHHLLGLWSADNPQTSTHTQLQAQPQDNTEPANPPDRKARIINRLTPPKQEDIKAQSRQIASQQATSQTDKKPPASAQTATVPANPGQPDALTVVENRTKISDQPALKPLATDEKKPAKKDLANQNNASSGEELQPKLKQDYLYIHQLDFAIRKNIPNVKISIHIYDPEPENRMLMINGEKFAIGDSIEDLLTVYDIVPEGVILAYENIRFLLPK